MLKKIITVLGARPQFIKASAISEILVSREDELQEVIIHTGQHYDHAMSASFFEELSLPDPKYNLGVNGGGHGQMTGRMLEQIEKVLVEERPNLVVIYGDTNSTLAGALAARKLNIKVAHVESGLRSFNMNMPEEVNRVLTDRISDLLFCPTSQAQKNLWAEGQKEGVHLVGDVMLDVALRYSSAENAVDAIMKSHGVEKNRYVLATCHRAESTNTPSALESILQGLAWIARESPLLLPLHPRTRRSIADYGFEHYLTKINAIGPVSYAEMLSLERFASVVVTDSGGVQKEAYFFGRPCVTMRNETEWVETVEHGWNIIAGLSASKIYDGFLQSTSLAYSEKPRPEVYGDGQSATKIVNQIVKSLC